jgi:C-7 ketoreductase
VVVTGGGTGIGRAIARAFADRGDRVLIVGRNKSTLDEAADGRNGIYVLPLNITDSEAPEEIVRTAEREFGGIDVLVNNAAIAGFQALGDIDEHTLRDQIDTNLRAPILLTQRALVALRAAKGIVVNISSAGSIGLRSMPTSSVYAATKVAIDSLTRTWAVELGQRGIRVVALAPGLIDTGVGVRAGMPQQVYDDHLARMRTQVPSGRIGSPDEIAWWVLLLTDPAANYANGSVFVIDGGLSLT